MISRPQDPGRVTLFLLWLFLAVAPLAGASAARKDLDSLIAQFRAEKYDWRQFEIGEEIIDLGDRRALRRLEPWLKHEDRTVRGNVAFIFAKFGDPRGFATIVAILHDYSADRRVQFLGVEMIVPSNESPEQAMEKYLRSPAALREQIKADRHYAVHLLGELRDPGAIDVLVPLLDDDDINYKVGWAIGKIQDKRAIAPLIAALGSSDALVRTSAIEGLVELRATEAIPKLKALLSDPALPQRMVGGRVYTAGPPKPVGQTAREALEILQRGPQGSRR